MSEALSANVAAVRPVPTEEELVAIVAAVEMAWPRPVILLSDQGPKTPAWRFSGRWWTRSAIARRDRP